MERTALEWGFGGILGLCGYGYENLGAGTLESLGRGKGGCVVICHYACYGRGDSDV